MNPRLNRSEPPGSLALPAQIGAGEGRGQDGAVGRTSDEVAVTVGGGHLEAARPPAVVAASDLDLGPRSQRSLRSAGRAPRIGHQLRSLADWRRAGKVLAALAMFVVVATSCGVVRGAVSTIRALDKAGFDAANIEFGENDTFRVTVEKDTEDLHAAATEAAGVVWRELPLRIEGLEVTCGNGFGGKGTFAADRASLEQRFGARDPDLDRGIEDRDVRTVALVVLGMFVLGLLVLGAILVLVFVLIRRSRSRQPPPGTWGPGGPAGPGGGEPQPPPPGYGPPA